MHTPINLLAILGIVLLKFFVVVVIIGYCCCVVWELSILFYDYVYYGCFVKYSHTESRLQELYSYFKIFVI